MKTLLAAATAAFALLSFAAIAHAEPVCVRVQVLHLRAGQGPLMLAAYGDATNFRKKALSELKVAASAETMDLAVCGLTGTNVALTLFQDLNDNGKLDTNPFGVPTEPWAASGKTSPVSAPTWDSAQVPLDGRTIVVDLGQ